MWLVFFLVTLEYLKPAMNVNRTLLSYTGKQYSRGAPPLLPASMELTLIIISVTSLSGLVFTLKCEFTDFSYARYYVGAKRRWKNSGDYAEYTAALQLALLDEVAGRLHGHHEGREEVEEVGEVLCGVDWTLLLSSCCE
jgi:hypothetical protein